MRKRPINKLLSLLLALVLVLGMLPMTAQADMAPYTISTGTVYPTLSETLANAPDGAIITFSENITESVTYTVYEDKTITIDGGDFTLTGTSTALTLIGTGLVKLQNLTLQSNASSGTSTGLDVSGSVSVQSYGTVTANGSAATASSSYGVTNSGTGTVDVTEAVAAGMQLGFGAYNTGSGTINVGSATGSGAMNGVGAYNNAGGTINVTTATGSRDGVTNHGGGTINVTTAISNDASFGSAITNIDTGTVNAGTATGVNNVGAGTVNVGTVTGTTDTGIGIVNTGTDVTSIPLHVGTGASCVLDSITIAKSGSRIGTLPDVYKGSECSTQWYTGTDLSNLFQMQEISSEATLYSGLFTPDTISMTAISGITAPVRDATPTSIIADTAQYTATISWSPAASTFAASTAYTATITITPKAGYTLTGVSANFFIVAGATATNAANSGIVTAVFPATAAAPSNGGHSDGGGGGSTSTVTPPTTQPTTPIVATSTEDSVPSVTGTTTATATISANGKATVAVTESQITDAVNKAVEAAAKQGTGTEAKVEIKVTAPTDAKTVEASLPKAAVTEVAGSNTSALTVTTPVAAITFDKEAINTISKEAAADVKITASKVDSTSLTEETKAVVGDRPVFNLSVTSGDKTISQFGGNVSVAVPYTPKAGEDTSAIVIYYINAQGKPEIVSNCSYDPATGTVKFATNHFSQYAVGYNKVSFKDVAADTWYSKAVSFVAARGITTGTGDGKYSPEAAMTRGQFIVMVMKAYGIKPDATPQDNFADAGNTYYTNYLSAAKRLGLTNGTGNNKYSQDKEITQQEMISLLYKTLKVMGALPTAEKGKDLTAYTDANQIASWAKDAMSLFAKAGIIAGTDNKLTPTEKASRADMAQVLYNLLSK